MREDPMKPSEYIDEVLNTCILAVGVAENSESAGKQLLVRDHVGGPVQCVAAIVDGTAALGLLMDSAKKLPLRSAHLRACRGATGGRIEQEAYDQGVALGDEKSTELVEPDGTIDASGRGGNLDGSVAAYRLRFGGCVVVVKSGEVFLKLESRIELQRQRYLRLASMRSDYKS